MRTKEELDSTVNSSVYKKLYKLYISRKCKYCEVCGYHRGENRDYGYFKRHNKSWKKNSKRRKQYKIEGK